MNKALNELYNAAYEEMVDINNDLKYQLLTLKKNSKSYIEMLIGTINKKEELISELSKQNLELSQKYHQVKDDAYELTQYIIQIEDELEELRKEKEQWEKEKEKAAIKEHNELRELIRGFNNPLTYKKLFGNKKVDLDSSYPDEGYQE